MRTKPCICNSRWLRRRVLAAAAMVVLGPVAMAEDIDIYLTGTNVIADERPSILIIFDNSGSMDSIISGSSEPYNPATTYTGNFDSAKTYWSTSGVPADSSDGRKNSFTATNNRCASSINPLATSGLYSGDRIGRWDSGKKSWVDLAANLDPTYVDCKGDVDSSNTGTDGLGYPRNTKGGISGPYVSNRSQSNVNWNNLKRPTLYTGNYLNWYYSPAAQSKTRMQVAKDVIKNVIDGTANVRFGLMVFNSNASDGSKSGGRIVFNIKDMTDANKTALKDIIGGTTVVGDTRTYTGIKPYTYTPLSETMWEAYRYFAGLSVDYGDDDSDTTNIPPRDTSAESNGVYLSPFSYACQQAYVILVTDGEPTRDNDANSKIQALSGVGSCDNTGNISTGYCLDDMAKYMYNNDLVAARDGFQRVVTFTIRIKGEGESDSGLLTETANDEHGHGKSYTATTAQQITSSFQAALAEILSITTSFAAPSVSINAFNKLYNNDAVYFALFKPESTKRWNGNVKRYKINSNGDVVESDGTTLVVDPNTYRIKDDARSFWSSSDDGAEVTKGGAGEKVPARASRTIYTYTGSGAPSNVDLNVAAHKLTVDNSAVTLEMLGFTPSDDAAADAAKRAERINWIRGQDVTDEDNDTLTDDDRWKIGDVLHSRPLAITYGSGTGKTKVFIGSNDGSLRMINDSTGVEEWAFIPPELLSGLQEALFTDSEGGDPPHPYGLDGTPTAWIRDRSRDANNDIVDIADGVINPGDGDFVRIFIGMRRGGSSIYALDVTPDAQGNVYPKYMWRIVGGSGDFAKLGQTWSKPAVTAIRHGKGTGQNNADTEAKIVLIFGGGYSEAQDSAWGPDDNTEGTRTGTGNAIYIVDPEDGSRIWWASKPGSGATLTLTGMDYSIPSDVTVIDSNADGETDRLYVGDTGGQLWRIDLGDTLRKNNNGGSTGARLFIATDGDPATADDNRKFFYPPDVAQVTDSIYSTTENYDLVTIGTGNREDPKNTTVHDRVYAIRDTLISGQIASNFTSIVTSDLLDVTTTVNPSAETLKNKKGWYFDLQETNNSWVGEKALASSLVLNGVLYFTTYIPNNDIGATCTPQEGTGRLYEISLLTGAPAFENTNDTSLTRADRYLKLGGGIPSELVPVLQQSGQSGLVGVGGGAYKPGPPDAPPRFKSFWYQQ